MRIAEIRIWCEVSGGVTGSRTAWLIKSGVIRTFDTVEEARAVAARLTRDRTRSSRGERFRYRVRGIIAA